MNRAAVDPYRGEVPFRLGDAEIILRLDWAAVDRITKAWKADVAAAREENAHADWGTILNRAFADYDMPKVAFFIACCGQGQQPGMTPEQIMEASPARHMAMIATEELASLFFWGPQGPPEEAAKREVPFVPRTLSDMLSRWRRRTA